MILFFLVICTIRRTCHRRRTGSTEDLELGVRFSSLPRASLVSSEETVFQASSRKMDYFFFLLVSDRTVYLIMGTISIIIGSILNYCVRLMILMIQLGARHLYQRLMDLILDILQRFKRKIQAILLAQEPQIPPVIHQQAHRYPERENHQPDRLMYY